MTSKYSLMFFLFGICFMSFCSQKVIKASNNTEIPIREINLKGPVSSAGSEISGLTWYRDNLILLPQYPDRFFSKQKGSVFAITKQRILDYIHQQNDSPITPGTVSFSAPDFDKILDGFEGYEAICFWGDTAFLTIEVENNQGIESYLIKGKIDAGLSELKLDSSSLTKIPSELNIANMAHETLTIFNHKIVAIYEANGVNVNNNPQASQFDFVLDRMKAFHFPHIEFRITDATDTDDAGFFWAINYMYPGDDELLKPEFDYFSQQYGKGKTHQQYKAVERLIKLQINEEGIHLVPTPPIQIELIDDKNSRNWEGLAKLDNIGFLLVTDKFPETILAFVPYPDENSAQLVLFEKEGKYGFKNRDGNEIIPATFDMALNFSPFGIAAVVDDSGWVYINSEGKKIIRPFIVDNGPDYFSEGLARYVKNNKIGFFDESGNIVIKAQFDFARPFFNDTAEVCDGCRFKRDGEHSKIIGGEWKIIDKSGNVISDH